MDIKNLSLIGFASILLQTKNDVDVTINMYDVNAHVINAIYDDNLIALNDKNKYLTLLLFNDYNYSLNFPQAVFFWLFDDCICRHMHLA